MQIKITSLFKELFLTNDKTEKNLMIVEALSPRFLGYLRKDLVNRMMDPFENETTLKERIDQVFIKSYKHIASEEELANCIEHDYLCPGGYFYELGIWFQSIYINTLFNEDARKWGGGGILCKWGDFEMALYNEGEY
jgi:hypothetical protein